MNPNNRSEVDGLFSGGDLTTLVDLQKFLSEEFGGGEGTAGDLSRAFMPLTDGLGIHSNGKKKAPAAPPVVAAPVPVENVTEFTTHSSPAKDTVRPSTRLIMDAPSAEQEPVEADFFARETTPPPVPMVGLGRRFLSGVVDQCFVFLAFLLALAITSNAISAGSGSVGAHLMQQLSSEAFLRSAALEFAMIWIGYLTLSFAVLDMTFGMWVWGLRVHYGKENVFWKRLARVVLGMVFYPLVFPSVLLAFQQQGRNLADKITKTNVYRVLQS